MIDEVQRPQSHDNDSREFQLKLGAFVRRALCSYVLFLFRGTLKTAPRDLSHLTLCRDIELLIKSYSARMINATINVCACGKCSQSIYTRETTEERGRRDELFMRTDRITSPINRCAALCNRVHKRYKRCRSVNYARQRVRATGHFERFICTARVNGRGQNQLRETYVMLAQSRSVSRSRAKA